LIHELSDYGASKEPIPWVPEDIFFGEAALTNLELNKLTNLELKA